MDARATLAGLTPQPHFSAAVHTRRFGTTLTRMVAAANTWVKPLLTVVERAAPVSVRTTTGRRLRRKPPKGKHSYYTGTFKPSSGGSHSLASGARSPPALPPSVPRPFSSVPGPARRAPAGSRSRAPGARSGGAALTPESRQQINRNAVPFGSPIPKPVREDTTPRHRQEILEAPHVDRFET